jgi:hypothetical protein
VAFAPNANQPTALPLAKIIDVQESEIPVMSVEEIKTVLNSEVQKILEAGHLRPGYVPGPGIFDLRGSINCGDDLVDYWHNPAETIYTLLRTLPYLPDDLRQEAKAYLQSEFDAYPPYQYNHIGWQDGAPREIFDLPEDMVPEFANYPAKAQSSGFAGWASNPYAFYGLWMYTKEFGNAVQIFNLAKNSKLMDSLIAVPADEVLQEMPFVHNAYVAGYIGYIELAKLANSAEDLTDKQIILDQLLSERATNFSKDAPDKYFEGGAAQDSYCRSLNVSRNFMFLVPELAQYLRVNAMSKVQEALDEYQRIAPFWFVSAPEEAFGEGGRQHLYDYHAIFQAKAFILQESYEELAKYLDVPAVAVGDLFYIQNLISTIEAAPAPLSTSEVDSFQSTHSQCGK